MSKVQRRREPPGGWFDRDHLDRGRDERPRSASRERADLTRGSEKGRRDRDVNDRHRSPDGRKRYDVLSSSHRRRSRGRSRSVESRHSTRYDNASPHRSSKRHRHSRSPRHSSHRHKRRHGSASPEHKRRRSRSPGHRSSSKHKRPRRPRSRSREPSSHYTDHGKRDISPSLRARSPPPKKHKSSTRYLHRGRSTSGSPVSRRDGPAGSDRRDRSPRRRREVSPTRSRGYSPGSRRRPPSPLATKSRYSPPPRERTPPPPRSMKRDNYAPSKSARRYSRSRSPHYEKARPPTKSDRSPARSPVRGRSPARTNQSTKDAGGYSPPPLSPPRRRSPRAAGRPLIDRITDPRDRDDPRSLSRRISLESRRSPPPRPTSPVSDRQPHSPGPNTADRSTRKLSPVSQRNTLDDTSNSRNVGPDNGPPIDTPTRPRGRGRGGRGRGHEHHRNQPLGPGPNGFRLARGAFRGRADAHVPTVPHAGAVSPVGDHPSGPDVHPSRQIPTGPDADRRHTDDHVWTRGGYRGRGSNRGRGGKGRFFESPDPLENAPTGPSSDKRPKSAESQKSEEQVDGTNENDTEMLPPVRPPPSDDNEPPPPPPQGPFKRVLQPAEIPTKAPPTEPKNSSFRPFTMNLPPKSVKATKPPLAPKALEVVTPGNFATGSNSSPLGKPIDLSARLGRARGQPSGDKASQLPQREPSPMPPPPPPQPEVIVKEMQIYHRVSMVGEGTYGKVYKASNNLTKELVALKRIRMESERDGFPITAVREMRLLQALKHDNIVSLLEMMVDKSDFYMVFDYNDHDLTGILNHPTFRFELSNIKDLARQFFDALHYLHHRGVLHRDIKGSNILLSADGQLKIADFGLARFYSKNSKKELDYTNRIITLWYRPPEILLGATAYGPAVDMWSAACVFIELFTRQPAFTGRTEIDQLDTIYNVLGRPTEKLWPALKSMPWYLLLQPKGIKRKNRFRKKYEGLIPPSALDLILQLLHYDPEMRPTAEQCLQHQYFSEDPAPVRTSGLRDLKGDWHEYESKMERRKERDNQKKRHDAERRKKKAERAAEYDPTRVVVE